MKKAQNRKPHRTVHKRNVRVAMERTKWGCEWSYGRGEINNKRSIKCRKPSNTHRSVGILDLFDKIVFFCCL